MNDPKFIITIGRQFGSGGREIGNYIATKLNIKYYDKEILAEAAKDSGVREEFFEKVDEKSPSFFDNIFSFNFSYNTPSFFIGSSPLSPDNIYVLQSKVIRQLAKDNSCVIVGRSADYVLRDHPCCINIFIHASLEARINRIMHRKDCISREDAKNLAVKKDKLRSNYYNYYTDKIWGKASSYDLSIDSSKITSSEIGDLIIEYVKMRVQSSFPEALINE